MATMRTSLRDVSRPTGIDDNEAHKAYSHRSRHHGRRKHSTKRRDSAQSPQEVRVHPKKISDPISDRDNAPSLELDFMHEPDDKIALGKSVKTDVLVSLRYPQQTPSVHPMHLNYSRLITFATLVAEDQDGGRIPMDASAMLAQKTCDTVHSFQQPEKQCVALWHHFPDRLPLGSCSFTDLRIARPGTYRLRVTLMRTGGSAEEGAINLACIDSMPINVGSPTSRRR